MIINRDVEWGRKENYKLASPSVNKHLLQAYYVPNSPKEVDHALKASRRQQWLWLEGDMQESDFKNERVIECHDRTILKF